ncbi:MAG: GNAT family N-acetyltransferase [Ruminococcus sp.]|nr:GNAT family N-acetyltransferase [Ruminococcus sp.]
MIIKAKQNDLQTVYEIVQATIAAVYPHYYPAGAVQFFQDHHSIDHISADISDGNVYLLCCGETVVGTVTIVRNEINRLFVLPAYQGRGYGGMLMEFAETEISAHYEFAELSSSFSAQEMYQKLGYIPFDFRKIACANDDWLCYAQMRKEL